MESLRRWSAPLLAATVAVMSPQKVEAGSSIPVDALRLQARQRADACLRSFPLLDADNPDHEDWHIHQVTSLARIYENLGEEKKAQALWTRAAEWYERNTGNLPEYARESAYAYQKAGNEKKERQMWIVLIGLIVQQTGAKNLSWNDHWNMAQAQDGLRNTEQAKASWAAMAAGMMEEGVINNLWKMARKRAELPPLERDEYERIISKANNGLAKVDPEIAAEAYDAMGDYEAAKRWRSVGQKDEPQFFTKSRLGITAKKDPCEAVGYFADAYGFAKKARERDQRPGIRSMRPNQKSK